MDRKPDNGAEAGSDAVIGFAEVISGVVGLHAAKVEGAVHQDVDVGRAHDGLELVGGLT